MIVGRRTVATLAVLFAGILAVRVALAAGPVEGMSAGSQDAGLVVEFIGNMAFAITDGTTVLYSDFPYRSGAFGYMEYPPDRVGEATSGIALITHEHADHWEPALLSDTGLRVVAHPLITAGLPTERVVPWSERLGVANLEIVPVASPHTAAHVSYRVEWAGQRLYFSGDTESTRELLAQRGLDVAFVSPWLIRAVMASGERIDARLVIAYHHVVDEDLPAAEWLRIPGQGDRFELR